MRSTRLACTLAFASALFGACDSGSPPGDDDGDLTGGHGGTPPSAGNAGKGTSGSEASGAAGSAGSNATAGSAGTLGGTSAGGSSAGSGGSTSGSAGTLAGASAGGSSAGTTSAGTGGTSETSGGSAGTTGGGGSSADPCASALLCDDFEGYTVGQVPGGHWLQRTSSGAVAVDETRHASGTKAVKFTTTGTGSSKTAYMRVTDIFPVPNNTFYGRMLFYLDAAPTTSVHWTFIQGSGLVEGEDYHAQYRYGGQQPVNGGNQLMANYETPDSYSGTGPGSDCWNHANAKTVPVGVWACAEWKFDGQNDEMRFWLDGVALEDLSVSGTGQGCVNQAADYRWTAPNFNLLELGWESYQTDTDRTLYIDDVVISTTQVGCPE